MNFSLSFAVAGSFLHRYRQTEVYRTRSREAPNELETNLRPFIVWCSDGGRRPVRLDAWHRAPALVGDLHHLCYLHRAIRRRQILSARLPGKPAERRLDRDYPFRILPDVSQKQS